MQSHVSHPGLVSDVVEARAYQLQAVDDAMAGSTLSYYPLQLENSSCVDVYSRKDGGTGGWTLVIAPTVALSNSTWKMRSPSFPSQRSGIP